MLYDPDPYTILIFIFSWASTWEDYGKHHQVQHWGTPAVQQNAQNIRNGARSDTQVTRTAFDIHVTFWSCKWPPRVSKWPFDILSDPLILTSIYVVTRSWHAMTRTASTTLSIFNIGKLVAVWLQLARWYRAGGFTLFLPLITLTSFAHQNGGYTTVLDAQRYGFCVSIMVWSFNVRMYILKNSTRAHMSLSKGHLDQLLSIKWPISMFNLSDLR